MQTKATIFFLSVAVYLLGLVAFSNHRAAAEQREERLANFIVRIGVTHHDIVMSPPLLLDGSHPRQAFRLRATRERPNSTQPGSPPTPYLCE